MLKSLNFKRILGLVIILAILVTGAVISRYFIDNAKKETKSLSNSVSADITMKTIHFTESEQNRKKWELFARSGSYDKPTEKTSLEEVRFIVERDNNKGPITVTAHNGEYLHAAKTVYLRGNVRAKTENGMTFETAQIKYESATKRFITNEKIRLTDESLTVEGVGMDLFVDRQQAIVKSQVDATVYPGKRKK